VNYFKSRLNLRTTHDVNGAHALASRSQGSGGAPGGLRRRRALLGPASRAAGAGRATAGRRGASGGRRQLAARGHRGGSSKPVRGRSPKRPL
jgi:hypothetical protein